MPFIAVKAHLAFLNSILYKCCYTTNSDKVWEMVVLMHLYINVKPQRGGSDICGAFDFLSKFSIKCPSVGQ
jgi:hypothetical protein